VFSFFEVIFLINFVRGDVFRCHFPDKVLGALQGPDYARIDGQSALAVCLTDSNFKGVPNGQTLVVPIVEQLPSHLQSSIKPVVVPLNKNELPFLSHDSYALTHMPIACNKQWIGPQKVGHINFSSSSMQRIDFGLLLSTGTYDRVRESIYDAVIQHMLSNSSLNTDPSYQLMISEAQAAANQIAAAKQPVSAGRSNAYNFRRGDVFVCHFPVHDSTGLPGHDYSLHGTHLGICLTDAKDPRIPKEQVLIVPISSSVSAIGRKSLKPTHIPIFKSDHPFLNHDSFALTFQTKPYNRHWLSRSVGHINTQTMDFISYGLFLSTGTEHRVHEIIMKSAMEALIQRTMKTPTLQQLRDFELGR